MRQIRSGLILMIPFPEYEPQAHQSLRENYLSANAAMLFLTTLETDEPWSCFGSTDISERSLPPDSSEGHAFMFKCQIVPTPAVERNRDLELLGIVTRFKRRYQLPATEDEQLRTTIGAVRPNQ